MKVRMGQLILRDVIIELTHNDLAWIPRIAIMSADAVTEQEDKSEHEVKVKGSAEGNGR